MQIKYNVFFAVWFPVNLSRLLLNIETIQTHSFGIPIDQFTIDTDSMSQFKWNSAEINIYPRKFLAACSYLKVTDYHWLGCAGGVCSQDKNCEIQNFYKPFWLKGKGKFSSTIGYKLSQWHGRKWSFTALMFSTLAKTNPINSLDPHSESKESTHPLVLTG